MTDLETFKEMLGNQAARGAKIFGDAESYAQMTMTAPAELNFCVKIMVFGVSFYFSKDGRFLGACPSFSEKGQRY